MSTQPISAEEMFRAKLEREIRLQIIAENQKRIADLGSVLDAKPLSHLSVEDQLEALPWTAAKSGKCDFAKNCPGELMQAVRADKEGFKGARHHFTAANNEATLFRFPRRTS